MSSYGFKAANANGELVIDGEYKNFCLFGTGEAIFSTSFTNHSPSYFYSGKGSATISNPGTTPIIAWKAQSRPTAIVPTSLTTLDCYAGENTAGSTIIPYAIFRQANAADIPSGSYGLALYNSSNELIWHSFKKWMKVYGVYPISWDTWNYTYSQTVAVQDAVNHYFIISPMLTGLSYFGADGQWWDSAQGKYISVPYVYLQKLITMLTMIDATHIKVGWGSYDRSYTGIIITPYPDRNTPQFLTPISIVVQNRQAGAQQVYLIEVGY